MADNIIAATTASGIDRVENYAVEELDFMKEEPEDIGVVCAMVNPSEEFFENECKHKSILDLEACNYE